MPRTKDTRLLAVRQALAPAVSENGIVLSFNDRIDRLYLELIRMPQAQIEPEHVITPGLYTRTATAKAGTMLISKTHLHDHQFIMSCGTCYSITDKGEAIKLVGPCRGITKAGTRRVCYIEKKTTWTSVHRSTKTTIPEIEAELFGEDALKLSSHPDHLDFFRMTEELGVTPEQIAAENRNPLTQIPVPEEYADRVEVRESIIKGHGLFANREFLLGDLIVPAAIGPMRTYAYRHANHSVCPNSILKQEPDSLSFIAVGPIHPGDEITLDYRQARRVAGNVGLLTDTQ